MLHDEIITEARRRFKLHMAPVVAKAQQVLDEVHKAKGKDRPAHPEVVNEGKLHEQHRDAFTKIIGEVAAEVSKREGLAIEVFPGGLVPTVIIGGPLTKTDKATTS